MDLAKVKSLFFFLLAPLLLWGGCWRKQTSRTAEPHLCSVPQLKLAPQAAGCCTARRPGSQPLTTILLLPEHCGSAQPGRGRSHTATSQGKVRRRAQIGGRSSQEREQVPHPLPQPSYTPEPHMGSSLLPAGCGWELSHSMGLSLLPAGCGWELSHSSGEAGSPCQLKPVPGEDWCPEWGV